MGIAELLLSLTPTIIEAVFMVEKAVRGRKKGVTKKKKVVDAATVAARALVAAGTVVKNKDLIAIGKHSDAIVEALKKRGLL